MRGKTENERERERERKKKREREKQTQIAYVMTSLYRYGKSNIRTTLHAQKSGSRERKTKLEKTAEIPT